MGKWMCEITQRSQAMDKYITKNDTKTVTKKIGREIIRRERNNTKGERKVYFDPIQKV